MFKMLPKINEVSPTVRLIGGDGSLRGGVLQCGEHPAPQREHPASQREHPASQREHPAPPTSH